MKYNDGFDDDGLDADGYPIPSAATGLRYRRGSEEAAGGWSPKAISGPVQAALARIGKMFGIKDQCESPIEVQLGAAIQILFDRERFPATLVAQFPWSIYRSDWAVIHNGRTILIECDGFEFHSTAEHLAHDAEKDRAAIARGYVTLRITGREIHRAPDVCAQWVLESVRAL